MLGSTTNQDDKVADEVWMRFCLSIAEKGLGRVGAGVMVGAALIRGNEVLAQGFHSEWGQFHAERNALLAYEEAILPDDKLYVNLEPCCPHATKKTPACTDIILERKVKNVIYGMSDPDPRVAGHGLHLLQKAGVHLRGAVLEQECRAFNRGFVALRTKNRPWITAQPDTDFSSLEIRNWGWYYRAEQHGFAALMIEWKRQAELLAKLKSDNSTEKPLIIFQLVKEEARSSILDTLKDFEPYARLLLVLPVGIDCSLPFPSIAAANINLLVQELAKPSGMYRGIASLLWMGSSPQLAQAKKDLLIDQMLM